MHNDFMLAALEQAWLGRGSCAPNPSVGAVVVHNHEIIARAWHQGPGTAHAERLVLQQIPVELQDLTLYVTLEPCNHWGRTPPCVSAIIDRGIEQVVYGFNDPNPLVSINNTPARLREKGIKVCHYPLAAIDQFYQSYSYWTKTKKPWVTVKMAQTLDAKIAGEKGKRCQLSNRECAEFTHQQRLYADIILTTAKTIALDDPLLNVRLQGAERSKPLAIIDSRLSLADTAKVFTSAKHCHIFYDQGQVLHRPYPNCTYHAVPANQGLVDLNSVFEVLGALGFHDVWVEAGAALFSALHQQQLVKRTYLYIVPEILGSSATAAFTPEAGFTKKPSVSWHLKTDNVIACLDWQEDACLPV